MNFEMYAYGSGDILYNGFNYIAMVFGSDDYMGALQTVTLIGFFGVFVKAAFDKELFHNFKWMLVMIVFLCAVLVPKTTVIINDKVNPSYTRVVANVPIGLAATASFFSFTANYLSRMVEVALSLPDPIKYTETGLLFPQSIYIASTQFSLVGDTQKNNFQQFFSSCVIVDGIGHNRFTWRSMMESSDLSEFFGTNVAQYAASFLYINSSGNSEILGCRDGWNNYLKQDIINDTDNIIESNIPNALIQRFSSKDNAIDAVKSYMSSTLGFLTGSSESNSKTVVQQAIINAMGSGVQKLTLSTNATEMNDYIISGANIERMSSYQALGSLASEKLPLLRTIFEMIIYCVFPIVALMAMVSPAKVSMSYLTILVWINLWAPTYAILNFISAFYSQKGMEQMAALYGGGYSVLSNSRMLEMTGDLVATTGYLATGLPMLTYMLVSKSGAMAASFAGRVMQGYDSSVSSGSKEIEDGKFQRQGVSGHETNTGTYENSVFNDRGTQITNTGNGGQVITQKGSSLLVDSSAIESTSRAQAQTLENATSASSSAQSDLSQTSTSLLSEAGGIANQLHQDNSNSESFKNAESVSQQQNLKTAQASVDKWMKKHGESYSDAAKDSLTGGFQGSVQGTVGTPLGGIIGSKVSASGTAMMYRGAADETAHMTSEQAEMVKDFQNSSEYSEAVSKMAQGTKELAAQFSSGESDSSYSSLDASISKQSAASEKYSQSISDVKTAKENITDTKMLQDALTVNKGQALFEALKLSVGSTDKVDDIIQKAIRNNYSAMEQVKFAVENTGYFNPNNSDFAEVRDKLRVDGTENFHNSSVNNLSLVDSNGVDNKEYISVNSNLNENDINNKNLDIKSQTLETLNSEHILENGSNNISKDGVEVKQKVDGMNGQYETYKQKIGSSPQEVKQKFNKAPDTEDSPALPNFDNENKIKNRLSKK